MTFEEAESRFRWLETELAAGRITAEQYRAGVAEIRVVDADGRHWMLQERTGQWHWYNGSQWLPATPPRAAPPAPPYAPQPSAHVPQPQPALAAGQTAPAGSAASAQAQGGGCRRALLYIAIAAGFWTVVAVVVFIFWGREQPALMAGIGLAALLSFAIMGFQMLGAWEGQIVDIRRERVRTTDQDGHADWEDVNFAYIREPSGKVRKMRSGWGWQVGDYLVKRRGDPNITKVRR
ncbi:MAG: hypothetical protein ACUVX9_13470 [Anaerolineae bacterium]